MFSCPECATKALPEEYRAAGEGLFPPGENGTVPVMENAGAFAEALGISADYAKCMEAYKSGRGLGEFLVSFQNNLALLIQKTWVEKADENRKEDLLDRLPAFIAEIEKENYFGALEEFGAILEELAYLFFGVQSQKDDFTEYTIRIDPHIGLFWWYGGKLNCAPCLEWAKSADKGLLLAVLLLGICYLTDF